MQSKDISFQLKKGPWVLLCLVAALALSSCHGSGSGRVDAAGGTRPPSVMGGAKADSVDVEIVPVQLTDGWGYKINVNHRPYIYQRQIPVIGGSRPFPTRESAEQVAEIVRRKILEGAVPSVTREELSRVLPENFLGEDTSGK